MSPLYLRVAPGREAWFCLQEESWVFSMLGTVFAWSLYFTKAKEVGAR